MTEVIESRLKLHQDRADHIDYLMRNYGDSNWPGGGRPKFVKDFNERMVLEGIIEELKHILGVEDMSKVTEQPAQQGLVVSISLYEIVRGAFYAGMIKDFKALAACEKQIEQFINTATPQAQQEPVALNRDGMKKLLEQSGYDTACPEEKTAFLSGVRHREAESLGASTASTRAN